MDAWVALNRIGYSFQKDIRIKTGFQWINGQLGFQRKRKEVDRYWIFNGFSGRWTLNLMDLVFFRTSDRLICYQSTSDTKLHLPGMLNKRQTTSFLIYGNYRGMRKITQASLRRVTKFGLFKLMLSWGYLCFVRWQVYIGTFV